VRLRAPSVPGNRQDEVSALIEQLHQNERRLEALTGGEVDTVADAEGRPLLMQRAQSHLRDIEALKQAAILNALPAQIALLDGQGFVVSANDAWNRMVASNPARGRGLRCRRRLPASLRHRARRRRRGVSCRRARHPLRPGGPGEDLLDRVLLPSTRRGTLFRHDGDPPVRRAPQRRRGDAH
jgi:PAS domain-containing protein